VKLRESQFDSAKEKVRTQLNFDIKKDNQMNEATIELVD
jgi:hypothetical protein